MKLDPKAMKIGYVVLVAGGKPAVRVVQAQAGFGESSKWTHVCGSLGGLDVIEGHCPRSRIVNLQKTYVDKGRQIKVLKRRGQGAFSRYKVALWWASMNNLPYDSLQFFWFPLSLLRESIMTWLHGLFSSRKRFLCSELIAAGFYKEGDYFGKPEETVMPSDFDDPALFEEVTDIWM